MKKTACIFLSLFALLAVAKAQEIVKVGAFNYYPAIFKDTDGVIKGFYVDALTEFGKKENLQFVYVYGTWAEGLERIKTGEVDLLTSVAITEERLSYMDYTSTPLLTVWNEVYVNQKSEIDGILDLEEKSIAVMKSDINGVFLKQLTEKLAIKCKFVETTDFDEVFKLIADGNVDAGVVNNIFGASKSYEYQLISSGIVFNPFDIYLTVKKGSNQELLNLLNTTLHNWKHNGKSVLNTARKKWSHENVGTIEVFPNWLKKAIYSTLLIIVALILFIALLRYRIRVATKSIRESEERFLLAMKASNDGLFDWNLETNDIYYSPGWKKMLGYEDHELPNDFSIWEKTTDPEDVKKSWELQQKLISKQIDRFVMEFKMKHKDGHWVDILARAEAFFNNQGKAVRMVGTHVDITERKKAENHMAESEYQLQAMINAVPDLIFRINTLGVFLSYKADIKDLYVKSDSIIGKNYREILPQYFTDILDDKIEKAFTTKEIQTFEYQLEMPEKGIRVFEARMSISGENEVTSVVRDITERKKAEEKLKETNTLLRIAGEKARLGGWSINIGESKVTWSDEVSAIHEMPLGYSPLLEEAINFYAPQWREKITNLFNDCALKGISFDEEMEVITSSGKPVWVRAIGEAISDNKGKIIKVQGAFQEISERKKAEIALSESEDKFRTLFNTLTEGVALNEIVYNQNGEMVDYKVIEVNEAFYKTGNYSNKQVINNVATNLYGMPQEMIKTFWENHKNRNETVFTEMRSPLEDKYFYVATSPFKNNRFITSFFDITELKKAEEALHLTRFSIDRASDGLFWMTPDARIIDCNMAACNSLGYTKEELLKLTIPDIDDEYQFEKWMSFFKELRHQSKLTFEAIHRHKDGHSISVEIVANYIQFGNMEYSCAFVRDITERKQAEEEILLRESYLSAIIENQPGLLWLKDIDGRFLAANTKFLQSCGLDNLEQLLGKTDLDIWPEELALRYRADDANVIELGKPYVVEEVILVNGVTKWFETHKTPVSDEFGKTIGTTGFSGDITERKKAEEAIKESENKYRQLFDLSPVGTLIVGMDKRFIKCNAAFCNFLGYSENEMIGKHISEITYPEDVEKGMKEIKQIADGITEAASVEKRYIRKDGQIVWGNVAISVVRNVDIKPLFLIPIIQDITQRKQAEDALIKSELQLRESQRVSKLGSYSWDLSTGLWNSSDILDEIFGIDENYVRSLQGWVDIIHADWKELMNNYVANEVLGKHQRFDKEYKITRIDNKQDVWVHGMGELVLDESGNSIKLIGTIQDINLRKLAEETIKENEQKLNALFASMTEMVAMHELVFSSEGDVENYRIIDCNAAYTQVTGIKKEDAVGHLSTEVYGTETPPYLNEFSTVAITGIPYSYTTYFAPMDKHFSISVVSPKKNQFATITTDITAMQQIQDVISAKNKELENYLYVSSHDLRSPLVNIQGFSQRLQKQVNSINSLVQDCELEPVAKTNLTQITNKSIPETLNYIFTSVAKMDVLINSLLQISRVGRVKMEIKSVNINQLITNIINQLNFQLTEISATLIVGKLPNCYGDENTLNQLFANILDNAIKYRNAEVPLIIKIEGKLIYNKAIYSIKDNGIGIASKYLNKIWDVFYRVDPTIKVTGEGIGLSITKRIVDKHKGRIWVESEEGLGTTFYIELQTKEFEE